MQYDEMKCIFTYRVDSRDRIQSVNEDWLAFACENQASGLNIKTVIGRPLFRFLTGEGTRHLYQMIIDRVRKTQKTAVIPFRCDGPTMRRFMELKISPCADGVVQFEGRIVREEERERVALFDLTVARTDEFVRMCSWCKRIWVEGEWFEVELALKRLKLFNKTALPQITHSVCSDCSERITQELDGL